MLARDELLNPVARELRHREHFVLAEGIALGRALNLDEAPGFVHDEIHVGFGVRVLGVVKIENWRAFIDAG